MKPVDQTQFKTETTKGNCMTAAIASMLELPLEEVPNFVEQDDFWGSLDSFLKSYNLCLRTIDTDWCPPWPHFVEGLSPRGVPHIVIYEGDKMVHDPHPSRAGVEVSRKKILVPYDLSKMQRISK